MVTPGLDQTSTIDHVLLKVMNTRTDAKYSGLIPVAISVWEYITRKSVIFCHISGFQCAYMWHKLEFIGDGQMSGKKFSF